MVGPRIVGCMVKSENQWVYGRIKKFEWLNQESVGGGVELMMAEVELAMRVVGDGWCREPENGLIALVCGDGEVESEIRGTEV